MITIHGTPKEIVLLQAVLARNCTCEPEANHHCVLCQAIATDQRFLDGLIFARRQREAYLAEEQKR